MSSREFCETFLRKLFTEHLQETASWQKRFSYNTQTNYSKKVFFDWCGSTKSILNYHLKILKRSFILFFSDRPDQKNAIYVDKWKPKVIIEKGKAFCGNISSSIYKFLLSAWSETFIYNNISRFLNFTNTEATAGCIV